MTARSSPHRRVASFFLAVRRWLREPLIHFLLIGAFLFAADRYMQPVSGGTPSSKQIQLSLDDLSQMVMLFQSQWRREPTAQELARLVENKVQEEILYREALAMGLEKDDTIVKRRMAQKLRFLAEDVAAAREPETAELKSWFEKNNAHVRTAQPGELPPSLFLAGSTRPTRPRRCREGAGEARRPAPGCEARRFTCRSVYVPGLLPRPRAGVPRQGVRA